MVIEGKSVRVLVGDWCTDVLYKPGQELNLEAAEDKHLNGLNFKWSMIVKIAADILNKRKRWCLM